MSLKKGLCQIHGKSICDRHFQKVKLYVKFYENKLKVTNEEIVATAILEGQSQANSNRVRTSTVNNPKDPIKVVAFSHSISFPNPNIKYQLVLPGIKSTQGVTYHRSTGKIINHIYPDVDRTVGIELKKVKTDAYKPNHVGKSYKKYCETKVPSKIIESQNVQREKWQKIIDKQLQAQSNWIISKTFVLDKKIS